MGNLHGHLALELSKPCIKTGVSLVVLVVFIEGQANEFVALNGLGVLVLVVVVADVADHLGACPLELVVQLAHGVAEVVSVSVCGADISGLFRKLIWGT